MSGINWDNWHDALVRTRQVEMKALEIIEAVRRGEKVEDDLVECKSDWPALSKARQLAGLCNKARRPNRDVREMVADAGVGTCAMTSSEVVKLLAANYVGGSTPTRDPR
jgi:hypothetical protein